MTRADVEHDALIVACAISAGIHATLVPEHLREAPAAGAGFVAAAGLLAALAVGLTRRPGSRTAVAAAGAVLAGLLGSYALAVTSGMPLLQPEPEAVDPLALFTKAVELAGLAAALHLLAPARAALVLHLPRPRGTRA
jgi:hypothetical protein